MPPPPSLNTTPKAHYASLLDANESLVLRAMACRALARSALRGGERAIVAAGGCRLLSEQVAAILSSRNKTPRQDKTPTLPPNEGRLLLVGLPTAVGAGVCAGGPLAQISCANLSGTNLQR